MSPTSKHDPQVENENESGNTNNVLPPDEDVQEEDINDEKVKSPSPPPLSTGSLDSEDELQLKTRKVIKSIHLTCLVSVYSNEESM